MLSSEYEVTVRTFMIAIWVIIIVASLAIDKYVFFASILILPFVMKFRRIR